MSGTDDGTAPRRPLHVEIIGDPARLAEELDAGQSPFGELEGKVENIIAAAASLASLLPPGLDVVSDELEPEGEVVPTPTAQRMHGYIAAYIAGHERHEDPTREVIARQMGRVRTDEDTADRALQRVIQAEGIRLNLSTTPQGNVWRGICYYVRRERGLPDPL